MLITAGTTHLAYALTDEIAAYTALRVRAYRRDGTQVLMPTYTIGVYYVAFDVPPMALGEWMVALEGNDGTGWQVIQTEQGVRQ
jgi:hypothetical protein